MATETVNVTAVNDAPVAVNGSVTTDEDTDHVFGASDFNFTDANDSPPNGFAAVVITSLPTAGTLRYDGSAVVAGDLPLTRERRRPARGQARLPPGGQRQRHPLRDLRLPHPGQRRHPQRR